MVATGPVTAVKSKSGTYTSPHLHGETGPFWLEAWPMDSNKKGVFLKVDLNKFKKGADFTIIYIRNWALFMAGRGSGVPET